MAGTASKFATAMMSGAALFLLGTIPAGISIYMFMAMGQSGFVSASMILLAGFLGFIGFGLLIGCLYTVWWAFTKSGKAEKSEREDDSWKNMPYPKG